MKLLKGLKALITGGTAGIGRAIAFEFADQGADVAIFGTNQDRSKSVLDELQRLYPEQNFLSCLIDVSNKKQVDQAVLSVLNSFSKVDVLVNNAGIVRDGLLMKMTEQDWDEVLDTNLKSVYNLCQALVRPMMKARFGRIINISSVVGLTGNAGQVNYAASKAGMIGLTKALAKEVASRGITVNCIAPGFIETPMTDALTSVQKEAILKDIPMGTLGNVQDIAKAAVFLAQARYITGQVLTVDGGMVM